MYLKISGVLTSSWNEVLLSFMWWSEMKVKVQFKAFLSCLMQHCSEESYMINI